MDGTSQEDVNEALRQVKNHKGLLHDRTCVIGIANAGSSRNLIRPSWELNKGHIHTSPGTPCGPGQTSLNLFTKKTGIVHKTSWKGKTR